MGNTLKEIVDGTREKLRADPSGCLATFEVRSRQVDGLRSEARARQFTITVDEPEMLGGTDKGPNPGELVLASLATCQEITYRLYAAALGIPLRSVAVELAGDLDLRGFFDAGEGVRPGFQAIRGRVRLDSPASEAELDRLVEAVNRCCPVLDIIRSPTPVSLEVERMGVSDRAAE